MKQRKTKSKLNSFQFSTEQTKEGNGKLTENPKIKKKIHSSNYRRNQTETAEN